VKWINDLIPSTFFRTLASCLTESMVCWRNQSIFFQSLTPCHFLVLVLSAYFPSFLICVKWVSHWKLRWIFSLLIHCSQHFPSAHRRRSAWSFPWRIWTVDSNIHRVCKYYWPIDVIHPWHCFSVNYCLLPWKWSNGRVINNVLSSCVDAIKAVSC